MPFNLPPIVSPDAPASSPPGSYARISGTQYPTLLTYRDLIDRLMDFANAGSHAPQIRAYRNAIESGDPQQGKLQTAYNQALKTLISLEEEQKKRSMADAEYISKAEALTAIKTLIGEILSKLDDLPTDVAERCNKANPAQAIKPLQDWVRKTREEISSHDLLREDA